MENDIRVCEHCKFYEVKSGSKLWHTKRDGVCTRYPRHPVIQNGSMFMVKTEVDLADGCGEFVQK